MTTREKYQLDEVFIDNSPISWKVTRGYIERHKVIPYICETCGCTGEWQGGTIKLEVHHRNGKNNDNQLSNLHYLCPNCHALTENYRGLNKIKTSSEPITDEEFVQALKTKSSVRQAILSLGLVAAGANYERAKRLIEQYQIDIK